MLAQSLMIKRPVLDIGGELLVGFKPETYAREVAPSGAEAAFVSLTELDDVAGALCGRGHDEEIAIDDRDEVRVEACRFCTLDS